MKALHFCYLLLVLSFSVACTSQGQQSATTPISEVNIPPKSHRIRILNDYRQDRNMLVIYGSADQIHAEKYQQWLSKLSQNSRYEKLTVISDTAVSEDDLSNRHIFLVGTCASNSVLRKMEPKLPIKTSLMGLEFVQLSLKDEDEVGVLSFFEHPNNKDKSIGVLTGNSDESIYKWLKENPMESRSGAPWARWGYQIFKGTSRVFLGNFTDQWSPNPNQQWDLRSENKPIRTSTHYQYFTHDLTLSDQEWDSLTTRMEKRIKEMGTFVGNSTRIPVVSVHLYRTAETQGMKQGIMEHAYIEFPKREVHQLYNEDYSNNFPEVENVFAIRQLLEKPKFDVLEDGLVTYFADQWQHKGFRFWAAQLHRANLLPSIEELVNNQSYQMYSPLIKTCAAAAFVDALITHWGKGVFLEKYAEWQPVSSEVQEFKASWEKWLEENAATHPPAKTRKKEDFPYYRGMTFAHEGYNIYNGYGSQMANASLEMIASLHANAVAIVPYTGMRNYHKPAPFRLFHGAGGENDASVVFSHARAREKGMVTLLKPQVYVPGAWPGEIDMSNETDWDIFFQHYRRWIGHYAFLAEIHEMEMFCVGVEFVKATKKHPQKWRKLIRDTRNIFSGQITYAANWGEEIDNLTFGDELDFVGVNNYYPLSNNENATDKELKDGFDKVLKTLSKIAEREQKPLVLTELGFRSIQAPWIHPHAKGEGKAVINKDQERCYRVVLEGLEKADWCHGLFWWKWPSFTEYMGRNPKSFTPCGKPAEETLKEFYKKRMSE